ncbi:MAG: hypothetical protein AB1651_04110 [Pseudomonadota bacterium]
MSEPLVLNGLNGVNPLAFLAALGSLRTAAEVFESARLAWRVVGGAWRPILTGCPVTEEELSKRLFQRLKELSMAPFEADTKLPFSRAELEKRFRALQRGYKDDQRRIADLWAALGSDAHADEDGMFADTAFRLVRSGDSAGNGLPVYALNIARATTREALSRALFRAWDYQDQSKSRSLRLDPVDDQRYALRWKNPSKSGLEDGPGTMLGANRLALEGLGLFPTMCVGRTVVTTGFQKDRSGSIWFVWPIWTVALSTDEIRSALAAAELKLESLDHISLRRRGVEEVFKSQRIAQNQYYSNLTWGVPV